MSLAQSPAKAHRATGPRQGASKSASRASAWPDPSNPWPGLIARAVAGALLWGGASIGARAFWTPDFPLPPLGCNLALIALSLAWHWTSMSRRVRSLRDARMLLDGPSPQGARWPWGRRLRAGGAAHWPALALLSPLGAEPASWGPLPDQTQSLAQHLGAAWLGLF